MSAPVAEPGVVAPIGFDTIDPPLALAVDAVFEQSEQRIGVTFLTSAKVYVYLGLPGVHEGSAVMVPPSAFSAEPKMAIVMTLDPPPYNGPVKRILAVLS